MLGRNVPVRARVTTPVRGAAAAGGAERGTGEDELEPVSGAAEGAGASGAADEAAVPEAAEEGAATTGAAGTGSADRAKPGARRGGSPEVEAGANRAAGDAEGDGTC